jgi:hypothetical protein
MNRDILKIIIKYKTYNKPYHEELLLKTNSVKAILTNKISSYSSYAFVIYDYGLPLTLKNIQLTILNYDIMYDIFGY